MNPLPKPTREIDSEFTDFVKTKPCCLPLNLFPHRCTTSEFDTTQPHHVSKRDGTKGVGTKVSDRRQVPVCDGGHRYCEAHPQEVLPFLNGVIRKLNREYDALFPPKPKVERKKSPGLKSITVVCASCGQEEKILAAKLARFGSGLRYQCRRTGKFESVRVS